MKHFISALFAIAVMMGQPAFTAGSGGGGGSTPMPGAPTPSYDPVEEYKKGVQHLKDKEYSKAERAFKRVTKIAKKDPNSHYLLGLAHSGQEEWKPASRALAKAVKYNPDMHMARGQLVVAYDHLNKSDKAETELAKLQTANAACGETCAAKEDIDTALAIVATARREAAAEAAGSDEDVSFNSWHDNLNAPKGDQAYLGAIRLINLERYDEAKRELQKAHLTFGPHPEILTYIGFANRKQGNYEQAITHYELALSVDPDNLNANEYLGEYYVELGQMDLAKAQLDKLDSLCAFGCAQAEELRQWIRDAEA